MQFLKERNNNVFMPSCLFHSHITGFTDHLQQLLGPVAAVLFPCTVYHTLWGKLGIDFSNMERLIHSNRDEFSVQSNGEQSPTDAERLKSVRLSAA